jgi:hypothetical protein
MSNRQALPWLARTGQMWKLQADVWAGLLGLAGVLLGLVFLLAAFVFGPAVLWAAAAIWAFYAASRTSVRSGSSITGSDAPGVATIRRERPTAGTGSRAMSCTSVWGLWRSARLAGMLGRSGPCNNATHRTRLSAGR